MKKLKGTEKESLQFSLWNECLKKSGAGSVEKLYSKIHNEIRKNPEYAKKAGKQNPKRDHTKFHKKRLTNAQRKQNVKRKIEIRLKELKKASKK